MVITFHWTNHRGRAYHALMALSCPVDLDVARLRAEVQAMYSRVAAEPGGDFHFHRGGTYAVERLAYDERDIAALPQANVASFAGVGNPHLPTPIPAGVTIADLGCGSGTDLLIAAGRVGPRGRAIGIDMTESMARHAEEGARGLGYAHVEVRRGDLTALPIDSDSIAIVLSNGVLNLVPDKERALLEMLRVLRPGGRVQISDIALTGVLDDEARHNVDLWTA